MRETLREKGGAMRRGYPSQASNRSGDRQLRMSTGPNKVTGELPKPYFRVKEITPAGAKEMRRLARPSYRPQPALIRLYANAMAPERWAAYWIPGILAPAGTAPDRRPRRGSWGSVASSRGACGGRRGRLTSGHTDSARRSP